MAPLLAYHGTADSFGEFDVRHAGKASGAIDTAGVFWFAVNPRRANAAAQDAAIVKNDRDDMEYEEGANVMPVHLHLRRLKRYVGWVPDTDKSAEQIAAAKAKGFDGIVWELGERMGHSGFPSGPVYAVFDAKQISSAIGVERGRGEKVTGAAAATVGDAIGTVTAGRHVGPVVEVTADRVVQHVGRGVVRKHECSRLDRVPGVGVFATVSYEGGRGRVVIDSEVMRRER